MLGVDGHFVSFFPPFLPRKGDGEISLSVQKRRQGPFENFFSLVFLFSVDSGDTPLLPVRKEEAPGFFATGCRWGRNALRFFHLPPPNRALFFFPSPRGNEALTRLGLNRNRIPFPSARESVPSPPWIIQ